MIFTPTSHIYMVGIKGVAMTSLGCCLSDLGCQVTGCDVAEEFVTAGEIAKRGWKLDTGFEHALPSNTDVVIYTSAHKGQYNPMVQQARDKSIPTLSHAEGLAELFNQKQGIAVCGVGGKSTTSAMIAWILEKTGRAPSFAVGVGAIPGLSAPGVWRENSQHFVAEADEYVTDPSAPSRGEEITPRFSFLQPQTIVCTNIRFDHPDVYRDEAHTVSVFTEFFSHLKTTDILVTNADDRLCQQIVAAMQVPTSHLTFGRVESANLRLVSFSSSQGLTTSQLTLTLPGQSPQDFTLTLQLPGAYNVMNALAALAATTQAGIDIRAAAESLKDFRSTKRRGEFIGIKQGVRYYDDYGHHPHEIANVIKAFREWFPKSRLVVGFQSHTFSRTKSLFADFAAAFTQADEVVMIDIFASAREAFDPTITSELLCEAIATHSPHVTAHNLHSLEKMAEYCQTTLKEGDVFLTIGAGDIYHLHELL
jgi:UDP-N-acetylmuramate--alanine ligase